MEILWPFPRGLYLALNLRSYNLTGPTEKIPYRPIPMKSMVIEKMIVFYPNTVPWSNSKMKGVQHEN